MQHTQADILLKPSEKIRVNWPANFIEEDILEFKSEQEYETYDSYLQEFKNVWISPDSVIYRNGSLIKESLPAKQYEPYYRFKHLAKKILKAKKVTLPGNKKYLLITDLWSAGHFHWFCDILPKLMAIGERAKEFVLLLQETPYLKTIGQESLDMLQFAFEDIVWMKANCFYKIKTLFFASKLSPSGRMHAGMIKELRRRFIGNGDPGKKRIYISRSKAGYRKILNEEAVFEVLRNYGFEMLHPEGLNLSDQIKIFSSAETLMSIHGAGLTNCIFMHPISKVIELRRKEGGGTNVGYWHLADALDHRFYYYNGITDSDLPLVGRGCNLTIPPVDFEKKVLSNI